MSDEQKAAYIFAQAVDALIECQSMMAANQEREHHGEAPAYSEGAFEECRRMHCISHNDVLGYFQH